MKPSIAAELKRLQDQIDEMRRRGVVRDSSLRGAGIPGSPLSVDIDGFVYLGTQVLTSTTSGSVYVPTRGTTAVRLRMVGGGGQGGAGYSLSISSMGGGGAGGMYVETWISSGSLIAGGNYQCGAPGYGVFGNDLVGRGGPGGDTVIVIDGRTYVARGGLGGSGSLWTAGVARGGARQSLSQPVDVQHQEEGLPGFVADVNNAAVGTIVGGAGGSSPLGRGAGAQYNVSPGYGVGKDATGYGAGGGGATDNVADTPLWGGSGSQGVIIAEEYYSF